MAIKINGKAHAAALRGDVAVRISSLNTAPALAVILVGDNPASLVYIGAKKAACEEVGVNFTLHHMPENTSQEELIKKIDELNADSLVHGILAQQPFPAHIDKHAAVSRINPVKDVDCLHSANLGLMLLNQGRLLPCTPAGIIKLLKGENIEISGKRAVVVGRGDIVGKPLSYLLLAENATVTVCHSRTVDLPSVTREADILVAAIGIPKFITVDMVKPGAVVIDVGVSRLENGKLCGDVDFKACREKASYITSVIGGVGPMTVATLMENCLEAMLWQTSDSEGIK